MTVERQGSRCVRRGSPLPDTARRRSIPRIPSRPPVRAGGQRAPPAGGRPVTDDAHPFCWSTQGPKEEIRAWPS